MLKSEIKSELDRANALIAKLKIDIKDADVAVTKTLEREEKYIDEANQMREQLKKLSQSIYTMLRVKYPAIDPNNDYNPEEEEVLLRFLHELCLEPVQINCDLSSSRMLIGYLHSNER